VGSDHQGRGVPIILNCNGFKFFFLSYFIIFKKKLNIYMNLDTRFIKKLSAVCWFTDTDKVLDIVGLQRFDIKSEIVIRGTIHYHKPQVIILDN